MLIKITSDTYFISQRIKEIDKDYFIVFNTKTKHFEVHNKRQAPSTYCIGLPFLELDERCLDKINETRVENIKKLLSEIEKQNQKIEEQNQKNMIEKLKEVLEWQY